MSNIVSKQSQQNIRDWTNDAIGLVDVFELFKDSPCEVILLIDNKSSISSRDNTIIPNCHNKQFWDEVRIFKCATEAWEYMRENYSTNTIDYRPVNVSEAILQSVEHLRKQINNQFVMNISDIIKSRE